MLIRAATTLLAFSRIFRNQPIGLRGTCTLARLVMQEFDSEWLKLVEGGGLEISLYMRLMDDGRKLLQPVRKGWRWLDGGMVYCRRWEEEDVELTPMEVTVGLLRSAVEGVVDYLDFTFESGECVSNDLVRRLLNTREQLPGTYRAGVVDGYAIKLMTSGYSREQVQRILVNGIKGFQRRKKSNIGGGRLHRTVQESSLGRIKKKLLSKSSW